MATKFKITIPKPCHEDWNTMTPDETGRFCGSCAKSVVDFSNMKALEIQSYFIKNQGQSVCGRFKSEQLDTIVIQIPEEVLFSQIHFHKMFMLALLVCMGTTLFSCQNTNGDKQKIDGVEVVDSITESKIMGKPMSMKDSLEFNSTIPNLKGNQLSDSIHSRGSFLAGFTVTKLVIDSTSIPRDTISNGVNDSIKTEKK